MQVLLDPMLREQLEQVLDGLADRERKVKFLLWSEDGHPRRRLKR